MNCPYCGHVGTANDLATPEQRAYVKSLFLHHITRALRADLKVNPQLPTERPLRRQAVEGPLPSMRGYREKQLETNVVCDSCTCDFSVYGVFGFCPNCRQHNSLSILLKNLAPVIDLSLADSSRYVNEHDTEVDIPE